LSSNNLKIEKIINFEYEEVFEMTNNIQMATNILTNILHARN